MTGDVVFEDYGIKSESLYGYKLLKGATIWLTGLPQSGKSLLAKSLFKELALLGYGTYPLDGDNLRLGINNDLGFSKKDRFENIRRVGEIALLMNQAGLVVIVALVSPYKDARDLVRRRHQEHNRRFAEVYVATSLETCKKRDKKGHYKKAENNEIALMTGVTDVYEPPEDPEFTFELNDRNDLERAQKILINYVRRIT